MINNADTSKWFENKKKLNHIRQDLSQTSVSFFFFPSKDESMN